VTQAEILAAVDAAEAVTLPRRGGIITQQSMRKLAAELKQRCRDLLVTEQGAAR